MDGEEVNEGPAPKVQWWQQVDWPGAVAFVLACGVSFGMTAALTSGLMGAVLHDRPISEQGAQLLSTIFGAAIGALATFLGQNRRPLSEPVKKQ